MALHWAKLSVLTDLIAVRRGYEYDWPFARYVVRAACPDFTKEDLRDQVEQYHCTIIAEIRHRVLDAREYPACVGLTDRRRRGQGMGVQGISGAGEVRVEDKRRIGER